ncbi:hypothetical protein RND71_012180 [Anisodus tanguticus]|uniref:Uncharacterized protein n=1 Tax=Anisodus tanguticus TaxID=243964 RepID=A0AAE1SFD1_9SOLA|nr:hypothetical protein RND71_012180 [Anisodus tanguticus]
MKGYDGQNQIQDIESYSKIGSSDYECARTQHCPCQKSPPVLGHGHRAMQARRSYLYGNLSQRLFNPLQDFKMKNGAIVLARNFNDDENVNHHLQNSFARTRHETTDKFSR